MGKGEKAAGPVGSLDPRKGYNHKLVNESHLAEGGRLIGEAT